MSHRTPVPENRRAVVTCALGAVTGIAVGYVDTWQLGLLAGWITAAALLLGSTWLDVHGLDAATTRANAVREDGSRAVTGLLIVAASVASLAAVGAGLYEAAQSSRPRQIVLTVAAILSIGLAWAVVHTVFTLRYAHEYYGEPEGGIDFPGGESPTYVDFAYFAFGIGMAFQVSDTAITSSRIRGTVLTHTFVAYLFGTAIIAATINVVAGLV